MELDGATPPPPPPRRLCGETPAKIILHDLTLRVEQLSQHAQLLHWDRCHPCLAVVLVGDRPDSLVYCNIKRKAAKAIGVTFRFEKLRDDATEAQLVKAIRELNADDSVDGIIVQQPLPAHISTSLCQEIDPGKDVDGFHFVNVGKLATLGVGGTPFAPCTARGIMHLLDFHDIDVDGKYVVILGRSNVVGKPLSLMMLERNATVTVCHRRTRDMAAHTSRADIVVAAMGNPECIGLDHLKPDAVIIDVGVTVVADAERPRGYRLAGDVNVRALKKSSEMALSPVPGGVGPMTVAMLMKATVEAWDRKVSKAIAADVVCAQDVAAQEELIVDYGDRRSSGARMDRQ